VRFFLVPIIWTVIFLPAGPVVALLVGILTYFLYPHWYVWRLEQKELKAEREAKAQVEQAIRAKRWQEIKEREARRRADLKEARRQAVWNKTAPFFSIIPGWVIMATIVLTPLVLLILFV
jgi:cytochrome c-type biogenesis protein CcmH/NrfG